MAAQSTLEMPCLGRPFVLGTLYDCRNDSLIPGVTLWGPDTLDTANSKKMESSKFEIVTDDTFNEKTSRFDVSAGLKLSILSGLVKVSGAGEFLYDRTTSGSQARVCLCYTTTSKFEYLNMNQLGRFQYPKVFQEDIATHVVTAVQYGADAVFVFDRQVDSSESIVKVHGEMEAMLNTGIKFAVGGNAKLELSSQGRMGVEKIHCKFYGDFILPKKPTTYQDAIDVYHQTLPDLLGGADHPNHVPKKVWLYPLSKLKSEVQRTICEISAQLINDLQEIMESLHKLEVRINDLISNEVCTHFVHIKGDLEKLKKIIGGYRASTVKRLSTLLPKVRGGGEEEEKLADVIEDNKKSPFSDEQILSWVSGKETEINTLAAYLKEIKKYSIKFAFQPNEMVTLTADFEIDSILCFDFNVPAGKDDFLQKMEEYLHGETMQSLHESQSPWYRTQGLELRKLFRQFVNFVAINSNQQGSTCTFVVTNGTSESSKIGAMSLLVDGSSTEFEPPDQPDRPQSLLLTHDSLKLHWTKPKHGADIVSSYTICSVADDQPEQFFSTSEEYIVLTNLTPGSLYRFKIIAVSAAGCSPPSEIGIEWLPPDQPGKPHFTITYSSLRLDWTKPKNGLEIDKTYCYIISYQSADGPLDKWCTQTSSKECAVLTNLTFGSRYRFKVRADSVGGNGPDSEVSEVSLPPGPPEKSFASRITHDSIQLHWVKPTNGAHSVQYYIIGYRPIQSDQWSYQSTTNAQESAILSDLASNTTYYVKVQAVSETGKGPYSDLSDPIETLLPPPGKPYATNITHNSLQLNWEKPQYDGAENVIYTIFYHSDSNLSDSETWFPQKTSTNHFQIKGLIPKMTYHFQVRAEVATKSSSVSDVSNPIETLLPKFGKPLVTNVSYDSCQITWEKPECEEIEYYLISYHLEEDLTGKWQFLKVSSDKSSCVFPANSLKSYVLKIIAVINTERTLESDVITIKTSPRGVILLGSCKQVSSSGNPTVYLMPVLYTMRKEKANIAKAIVGEHTPAVEGVPHKILMLVGASGAGKSTLINGMANYIMGVDWDDDYRFKVISEEADQTKSQTKCITAYTFYKDKGSPLPYTLTVIDTPGFGDIVQLISSLSVEDIDLLHGIGFVTPAPEARLTPSQQNLFYSIASVFGKDVADSIFLMTTFADVKRPPVIDAVKAAGVPFSCHLKFNNSALFASKQAENEYNDDGINQVFWKMCRRSFEKLFNNLAMVKVQSLQQLKEYFKQQQLLKKTRFGLCQHIQVTLAKINEIKYERQLLMQAKCKPDSTYKILVTKLRKIDLPKSKFTTDCLNCSLTCLNCNFTCHENCTCCNNGIPFMCSAMENSSEDATCKVCPGKCSWRDHFYNFCNFEILQERESRSVCDLITKHMYDQQAKRQVKTILIKKLENELKRLYEVVDQKVKQGSRLLEHLRQLTFKPATDHLTEVEFNINFLIDFEEQNACPGWKERMKVLREVQNQKREEKSAFSSDDYY